MVDTVLFNSEVSRLADNVPIVDPKTGNPTAYFMRIIDTWLKEKKIAEDQLFGLGIDGLSDVDTVSTPPEDGQALIWDEDLGWWVPGEVASSGGSLGTPYEASPVLPQPLVSDFTWNNQGTAVAVDSTMGGIAMSVGTPGVSIHILEKAVPGASYSVYVNIRGIVDIRGSSNQYGIVLRNSTSGRLLFYNFNDPTAADTHTLLSQRWTNTTTFSATVTTQACWSDIHWLRIDVNSTTATLYSSTNGTDWVSFGSETLATFLTAAGGTVDKVGFGLCASANPCTIWVPSFSYTAPTGDPILSVEPPIAVGALELISEQVLSADGVPTDFSSIPSTYRDLILVVRGRGNVAATEQSIQLRFNSDSGANYDYGASFLVNTYGNSQAFAQTSILAGAIVGDTAPAGTSSNLEITITDYRGTTFHKSTVSIGGGEKKANSANNYVNWVGGGTWRSTAAITSISILNSLKAGSVVSLYGRL